MKKKPLAFFDIDGTIFRSSLLIELQEYLVEYGVFPKIVTKELESAHIAWLDRKGAYEAFINEVVDTYQKRIIGVEESDVKRVANLVIKEEKERVYRYTRDLLRKIRKTHMLVAISGSPKDIVAAFNRYWKFDEIYATVYEVKNKKFTGNALHKPANDKKKIVEHVLEKHGQSLKHSIGVGDTESDASFLSMVDEPIAFNPNKHLLKIAKRKNWHIVVERKDVIYRIS